jgi:prevent-host-death family protein
LVRTIRLNNALHLTAIPLRFITAGEPGRYALHFTFDNTYVMAYHQIALIIIYLRSIMPTLTATEARSKLYRLIDEAASSHEPIVITGKRGSAVLISEDDWRSIQETLYLLNIPGMRESIREGLATPIEECSEEIDW